MQTTEDTRAFHSLESLRLSFIEGNKERMRKLLADAFIDDLPELDGPPEMLRQGDPKFPPGSLDWVSCNK